MRYYAGNPPDELVSGSPWPEADIQWVDSLTRIAPGISLVSTVSRTPGTLELRELSLAIDGPEGLVLLVGCSHPGIETILEAARTAGGHVHIVFGGLHLPSAADSTIRRIASSLRDRWSIDRIAPGHCTGEPAFAELRRVFGSRYVYAGLGAIQHLP
jgi:7,8-dihydropterin-6-yl-methyl-4-(beta-D-ribofuranosyl)aminobenzene 5'-phosphate synthase